MLEFDLGYKSMGLRQVGEIRAQTPVDGWPESKVGQLDSLWYPQTQKIPSNSFINCKLQIIMNRY